jgi:hypothetical protein
MGRRESRADGFDGAAAVTRSLLGYGVLAGAFYLVVGLVLAVTREGFDLAQHPLSLLMLGDHGWMQRANLLLTGGMTIAAAVGITRAARGTPAAARAGTLIGLYGGGLILSGTFAPDPMAGFPAGTDVSEPSLAGLLHLAAGGLGFLCLAAGALVLARWFGDRGMPPWATYSRLSAALVLVGFLGGAALSTRLAGIVLLWLAVVAGWVWLAGASLTLYRTVPHPDRDRREPTAA